MNDDKAYDIVDIARRTCSSISMMLKAPRLLQSSIYTLFKWRSVTACSLRFQFWRKKQGARNATNLSHLSSPEVPGAAAPAYNTSQMEEIRHRNGHVASPHHRWCAATFSSEACRRIMVNGGEVVNFVSLSSENKDSTVETGA